MIRRWLEGLWQALVLPGGGRGTHGRTATRETLVFTARLPSSSDGLRFEAAFTLRVDLYPQDESERNPLLAQVKNAVVDRAYAAAREYTLGDHGLAEAALFRVLNTPGSIDVDGVGDTMVRVTLGVNEDDIALERRREIVGQQAQLARAEHRVRMERVEVLVSEVFKDPLTARIWWFEQNQDRWGDIEKAGEALDLLVNLSAHQRGAVSPVTVPDSDPPVERLSTAEEDPILEAFLSQVDEPQKAALLQRLTDILDAYGRQDLIRRLHEAWPVT